MKAHPHLLMVITTVLFSSNLVGDALQNGIEKPKTLCEVLSNREKFDGHMVKVRGIVEGNEHGAWLLDNRCRACVDLGKRIPCAVVLVGPSQAVEPVDFEYDRSADSRIRDFLTKHKARKDDTLWVTYIGKFETKPQAELFDSHSGRVVNGFGHQSSFVAQLVVLTVRDPALARK